MRPLPRLFAFTDRAVRTGKNTGSIAAAIASVGPAVALVARDHDATAADLTTFAAGLMAHARPAEAALFVAGRPDIAAGLGATGVTLRGGDLSVRDARVLLPHAWIGRSVHGAVDAAEAVDEGADFLVAGNVFETATHPGRPGRGLALIETITSLGRPVIAIGGITPERAWSVRDAGAYGVAAITALWSSPRPGRATLAMLEPWI